jgi:hypothetical protein
MYDTSFLSWPFFEARHRDFQKIIIARSVLSEMAKL